jgi:hypothetical protein
MKFLLIILLFTSYAYATDQDKYNQAIGKVNEYLSDDQVDSKNCPGLKLVITCGNKLCEPHFNETDLNCAADCLKNVSVRSYNNITLCTGYSEIQIPKSIAEVVDLVKLANAKKLKVRPIGASHSATQVMCSQGMLIPVENLKQVIGISTLNGKTVVEAQTGVTVFELSEWLHEKGYALDGLPHMGFRDVTIGGAIATGSHGSTTKHHGVLSNIIEAIEFIDGKGVVHNLEKDGASPSEFKALSASLGMVGITTKFKLRIQKQFNLAVSVTYHSDKEILVNGLLNTVENCDYGQLNWFPGVGKFMKTCGVKTQKVATAGANNELLSPNIPDFIVNPFKKILQLGACYNNLMCLIEDVRWLQYKLQPPFVVTNQQGKKENFKYLVGPAHRMVSSHLISKQEGFFQMDWEIAVPSSKAQEALIAIKNHAKENNTCLPLVGVFVRFAPIESQTLLAHSGADDKNWVEGETAVFFEMPVYVPIGYSKERFDAYEKQYVEFAKLLIERFSGRPHWGKNRQWAFDLVKANGSYQKNLEEFQTVINKYDPQGTYGNDFAKGLGFTWNEQK